jgi:organic hydroperoxide reductase OsmC/OhrA
MTAAFPHHYRVDLRRENDHGVVRDGGKAPLVVGPPPEFGGSGHWWSPEHLLLSAVAGCYAATVEALAARGRVVVDDLEVEVRGVVDKAPQGGIRFVSVLVDATLTVPTGQVAPGEHLLQTAKKHCIVANSLGVPVELVTEVREEAALPVGGGS